MRQGRRLFVRLADRRTVDSLTLWCLKSGLWLRRTIRTSDFDPDSQAGAELVSVRPRPFPDCSGVYCRTVASSVTELAEPFDMTVPVVSMHIATLEKAGLVARGGDAQWRPCLLG
jgi:DNA-binding transcriptional ArsR family regulator